MDPSKKALRRLMQDRRAAIFHGHMSAKAEYYSLLETITLPAILALLQPANATVVSGFYPISSEIDCGYLLTRLVSLGLTAALPIVVSRAEPLRFRSWDGRTESLIDAPFHTKVPSESCPSVEPDVLLVPMLAFRRDYMRLGYGGGFFDRTLVSLREKRTVLAVGLAFEGQHCEDVPAGATDQPVDCIVTEKGLWSPEFR